jgi:hypothetical protein
MYCTIFAFVALDFTIFTVCPRCTVRSLQLVPNVLYHLCSCAARMYYLYSWSQMYGTIFEDVPLGCTIFTVGSRCTVPSLQLVPDVLYHLNSWSQMYCTIFTVVPLDCTIFTVGPRCTVTSLQLCR